MLGRKLLLGAGKMLKRWVSAPIRRADTSLVAKSIKIPVTPSKRLHLSPEDVRHIAGKKLSPHDTARLMEVMEVMEVHEIGKVTTRELSSAIDAALLGARTGSGEISRGEQVRQWPTPTRRPYGATT